MGAETVGVALLALVAGIALGLWYGETRKTDMLKNLLAYGSPWGKQGGQTIRPETAESRLDRDVKMVAEEYQEATIQHGVAELSALYQAEGRPVPSAKDLRKEVEDMLSRAGTPEAGVPHG